MCVCVDILPSSIVLPLQVLQLQEDLRKAVGAFPLERRRAAAAAAATAGARPLALRVGERVPAAVRLEVHEVDEGHAGLAEEEVGLVVEPVPHLEPQGREWRPAP